MRINGEKTLLHASDEMLVTKVAQGDPAGLEVNLVSSV